MIEHIHTVLTSIGGEGLVFIAGTTAVIIDHFRWTKSYTK